MGRSVCYFDLVCIIVVERLQLVKIDDTSWNVPCLVYIVYCMRDRRELLGGMLIRVDIESFKTQVSCDWTVAMAGVNHARMQGKYLFLRPEF